MSIFKFDDGTDSVLIEDSEQPGELFVVINYDDLDYEGIDLPREQVEKLCAALGKWLHVGKHDWQDR